MLEYILFEIIREIDGTLRFTTQLITEYQKISGCFAIDRCQKRLNNNETLIFDTYKMTIPAQHSSFQPHLGSFDLDFKQLKLEQTIKFGDMKIVEVILICQSDETWSVYNAETAFAIEHDFPSDVSASKWATDNNYIVKES